MRDIDNNPLHPGQRVRLVGNGLPESQRGVVDTVVGPVQLVGSKFEQLVVRVQLKQMGISSLAQLVNLKTTGWMIADQCQVIAARNPVAAEMGFEELLESLKVP